MFALQDWGVKRNQRRKLTQFRAEEVRMIEAPFILGHDQELVIAFGPMKFALLDQAGLEIEKWVMGLDLKGPDALRSSVDGLDVLFPVKFSP